MTHKLLIAMGVMASPALMLASTVGDGIRFAANEFKTVKAVNKTRNQSVVRPMRQLDGRQTAAASSRQTIRPISRAASRPEPRHRHPRGLVAHLQQRRRP